TDHAIQDQVLEADNTTGYSIASTIQTNIDNAIQAKVKDEFNNTTWHYDRILEALTTTIRITEL
ncbi:3583_t:CDS:2, partial [Scutellospora calospora]